MSRPGFVDPATRQSSAIDLSRLLDQQTPLPWFDAVAIVQELCDVALHASGAAPAASLELSDVFVTSDGGVEVRGSAARRVPTVPQVAHVLLALIEGTPALPVQLRLLALQEVSPTPVCATLRDFSERLAPFERPNRRHSIRDVHEAFTERPARGPESPLPEPPRARPTLAAARPPWWRSRKLRTIAASAVLLAAAVVAVMWFWRVVAPLISDRDVGLTEDASAPGGDTLSPSDVERIRATARRIWSPASSRPAAPAPDAPVAPSPAVVEAAAGPPAGVSPPSPVDVSRVPAASASTGTNVPDETLYSAADADVVRPVLVQPHLPTTPRAGVRTEDLPQVEVVVSPEGEVESVKLVTPQAGVKPGMMLMAMKAWRFAPAIRAGRAVRYRLVVPLTNQ